MEIYTLSLLRQVAAEIRQPAIDTGRAGLAIEGIKQAVAYLVSEVNMNAKGDALLASQTDFADALRGIGDALERTDPGNLRRHCD